MTEEIVDFDIDEFLARIHGNKPPFRCPATFCQKICKSYKSIESHIKVHRAPEPIVIPVEFKEDINPDQYYQEQNNESSHSINKNKEPKSCMTYHESKKFVMLDAVDAGERKNKIFRVNIHQPLKVLMEHDASRNLQVKETEILDLPKAEFEIDESYKSTRNCPISENMGYLHYKEKSEEEMENIIEYDLDEEDTLWLEKINEKHKSLKLPNITQESMEWIIDRFEKLSKFQRVVTSEAKKNSKNFPEDDAIDDEVCAVCLDGSCENTNVILFCDVCNLPVHQECYGVPYIPEGSWLCRKCLHSPSEPVQCCLCPNAGGAFKKTSDERWAHVICGLWIPEVVFANLTFLEPLEDIDKVAPARWKLKCFICKKSNAGACIQCHKSTCYRAFHVTCAQQAGLYMKIEDDIKSGGIKKSVFCDMHCPADYTKDPANRSMYANNNDQSDNENHDSDVESCSNSDISNMMNNTKNTTINCDNKMSQKYLNNVRKALTNKRINQEQAVLLPYVSETCIKELMESNKFNELVGNSLEEENRFKILKSAYAFWKLKRALRRGVPLLKRLQASSRNQKLAHIPEIIELDDASSQGNPGVSSNSTSLAEQSKLLHILRQDLERGRLLSELTKKRERVKRDLFTIFTRQIEIQTQPAKIFLEKIIQILQERDKHNMFAEPVTDEIAPSYSKIIKNPMDFSTMKKKCHTFQYFSVADLAKDFHLMMDNCLTYNMKDSIFYKTAQRLRNYGDEILAEATNVQNRIGINPKTGMFYKNDPMSKPMDEELWRIFAVDNIEHMKQLMNDSCLNITIDNIPSTSTQLESEPVVSKVNKTPTVASNNARANRANRRSNQNQSPVHASTKLQSDPIPIEAELKRSKRISNHHPVKRSYDDQDENISNARSAKIPRHRSSLNNSNSNNNKNENSNVDINEDYKVINLSHEPKFSSPIPSMEMGQLSSKSHFTLGTIDSSNVTTFLSQKKSDIPSKNQFKDRPNFQNYQDKALTKTQSLASSTSRRYSLRESKTKSFPDFHTDDESDSSSPSNTSDEESCFSSEQESFICHTVSEIDKSRKKSLRKSTNNHTIRNQEIENEKHDILKSPRDDSNLGRQLRQRLSNHHHNSSQVERSPLSVKNQIIGYSKFSKSSTNKKNSALGLRKKRKKPYIGVKLSSYLNKKKSKRKSQRRIITINKKESPILIIDDENTKPDNDEFSQESVLIYNPNNNIVNIIEDGGGNPDELNGQNPCNESLHSSTSPVPLEISVSPSLNHSSNSILITSNGYHQLLSSNCSSVDCNTNNHCEYLSNLTPVWAKCLGSPWYPGLIMNPMYSVKDYFYHESVAIPTAPKEVLIKGLEMLWQRNESRSIKDYLLKTHPDILSSIQGSNMSFNKLEKTSLFSLYQSIETLFQPFKARKDLEINDITEIDSLTELPENLTESSFLYLILFFDTKNTWQWLPIDKLIPMYSDNSNDSSKLKQAKRSRMKMSILKAYSKGLKHFCSILKVPYPTREENVISEPYILFNSK